MVSDSFVIFPTKTLPDKSFEGHDGMIALRNSSAKVGKKMGILLFERARQLVQDGGMEW